MKKKQIFSIILLVLWCIFIFIMSSFNAIDSSNQSDYFVSFFNAFFIKNNISILTFIVRKNAHLLEYFILGFLCSNALLKNKIENVLSKSILFCILFACSDEIHQLFVAGRSCELRDVLIDSFGIIISCLIFKHFCKEKEYEK